MKFNLIVVASAFGYSCLVVAETEGLIPLFSLSAAGGIIFGIGFHVGNMRKSK